MKEIIPITHINIEIEVPGSKSLTQRALIAAALADGNSYLISPLASEDTSYTIAALRAMGINVNDSDPTRWLINGNSGRISQPAKDIYLGNNGTATRFLTSVAALGHGHFNLTGDKRMSERPIGPLIEALQGWGVKITCKTKKKCPPLSIEAKGLNGNRTILSEGKSSQYLSSLLLVAPYAKNEAEIEVQGEVLSKPYVGMTLAIMADFGIEAEVTSSFTHFRIPKGCYKARKYRIEGDASSASYFWAAAAVNGGSVTVSNVPVLSLQGDTGLVPLLARMGCFITKTDTGITVQGPDKLRAVNVDMGNMPDVAPTLAIVAAFAQGTTTIRNIAHLRIKECDRLSAVVTELRKIGAEVEEKPDAMIIHGQEGGKNLHGAVIETYNDHRIAMCFAVAGLRIPGIRINGEECVGKSFPDFWERLDLLAG